ncbi:MAG: PIG-L family deacetylase [Pseudohongiellaceae bacterium]
MMPDAPLSQRALSPPERLDVEALGRTLLLIPHPDDEVIGCGGLLTALAGAGQPACVALVSDGSGAGELPEGTAAIRQREFRDALEILYPGCEQQYWKLPDGALSRESGLAGAVVEAARHFRADTLVAPWPRDMHPDHAALGAAAQHALESLPGLRFLLSYETWSPLEANRILDITESWPRKTRALACHVTALQAQNYDRSMEGLARHRALLLPGISASETVRYAEAWHLQEQDRGRVNASARFVTRPACQADAGAIITLFREVFGAGVDRAWWDWKYCHPDWIGTVALTDDQQLAGFYGVVPRIGYWQGQEVPLCQMVDSMVADHSRTASRSSGAFLEMCLRFLTPNVGDGKPFALACGFPNKRAMRAGEQLHVYQRGEGTVRWSRPAQPWHRQPGPSRPWQRLVWRARTVPVESVDDLSWVDPLFKSMRAALSDTLLLERGAAYWYWRFRRHPQAPYRFLQLRRLGRIVAGGVLRQRDEEGVLELVDAVFQDHRAFHGLVKAAEHEAWRAGLSHFQVWGTERLVADLPVGEAVREGSVAWPDQQFNASLVDSVKGHFWAMGGDTDFR